MTFTLMLTATTVLRSSLLLLRRLAGGAAAAVYGGGFRPAVVDYHRSRANASTIIVSKCLKCQRRHGHTKRHVACSNHSASA